MKQNGTVKFYNFAKGFGFITDEAGTDILYMPLVWLMRSEKMM
jgi:hypothetical protein